ncbi:MAG: hypothetical protein ACE364_08965 [Chlorobiota bacterium]
MKKNEISQLINVFLIIIVPLTLLNLLIHVKRENSYKLVENDKVAINESYRSLKYSIRLQKNDQIIEVIIYFYPEVPKIEMLDSEISINSFNPEYLVIKETTNESTFDWNENIQDTITFMEKYEYMGASCIFRFENININDTINLKIKNLNFITSDFNYKLNQDFKFYFSNKLQIKSLDIHSDITYLILQYQLIACGILIFLKILVYLFYFLRGKE